MAGVEQIAVEAGEAGMRLDRWFKSHFPGLSFGHLQKLLRSGQVRIDGGRAKSDTRIEPGQMIRVPPLGVDKKGAGPVTARTMRGQGDAEVLAQMLIYEDPKVYRLRQAGRACRAGRLGHHPPSRRHAGGLAQRQGREAAAGAPARPRHVGRAGRCAHAACGHEARRSLSRPRRQEDLLGAGARRAARSARTRSRPGWSRSRRRTATASASPSMAKRAPTTPSRTTASSSRPRRRCPGWRWSRIPAARTSCASTPPISAARSSAIPNISRPTRIGTFPAACRTGCICMRAASSSRIPTAA